MREHNALPCGLIVQMNLQKAGVRSLRRFSSNYTNFINLYPSTAAFILHFPLSILNSPLT